MSSEPPMRSRKDDILRLANLLRSISASPGTFLNDTILRNSLRSQGRLASLSIDFHDEADISAIRPMSLNTLKKYSEEALTRGFSELDHLRQSALEALTRFEKREERSNKRTKSGLFRRVLELEKDLDIQRRSNIILLQAVSQVMSDLKNVCSTIDENIRIKKTRDTLRTASAILSLNPAPLDRSESVSSVYNIDDYR